MRVIPGGFLWSSARLGLDLSRYGIVVRHVADVLPARRQRILSAVLLLAEDLGFDTGDDAGSGELPPVGAAIVVHPIVEAMDTDLAIRVRAGSNHVRLGAEMLAPNPPKDDEAKMDDDMPDLS